MMKKLLTAFLIFSVLFGYGQNITITTTSNSSNWSPVRVTNTGQTLTWTATGPGLTIPIVINANDPTFDFSSNPPDSPIIIDVTSINGIGGLTSLDLPSLSITSVDLSNASSLQFLDLRYNFLTNLDISQNTALTFLNIRGNRQLNNQTLVTSSNTELTDLVADVSGINSVDFSNNDKLINIKIYDARLTSSVLDKILTDLDNHGLSDGNLEIRLQSGGGSISSSSFTAYNSLQSKNWTIDVGQPPSPVTSQITLNTTSTSSNWSPTSVSNFLSPLKWSVTGGLVIPEIVTNDPTFDFNLNSGTAVVKVVSDDGLAGLTRLDLSLLSINSVNLFESANLNFLDLSYNILSSLDISQNTELTFLNIRGNRQLDNQNLVTSSNTELTTLIADVSGINSVVFSNNALLTDVQIFDARLTSAVLDQVLIDLDNHGLSNGNLEIRNQTTGQSITFNSLIAYNNLIAKGWTIDVPAPAAAAGPKMNVTGNDIAIPHGTTTTNVADGTDFGQVLVGSTVTRTFEIQNVGDANLTIFPIGAPGGGFTITAQPASSVASAGTTTFQVTFTAVLPGQPFATVLIFSNDPTNPSPIPGFGQYTFAIRAEVVAVLADPTIIVSGNGVPIANNDTTPSLADDTDFGDTFVNTSTVKTFSISNTGTGNLTITDIQITNFLANEYVVETLSYPLIIPAGGNFDFDVTFSPLALGTFSAQVEIFHSDTDITTPFKFRITGKGIDPPAALMITQYYKAFGGSDNWVEIKNISGGPISAGAYYLVLYNQSLARQGLIGTSSPTSSVAIPALSVDETLLFKDPSAVFPLAGNIGAAAQIILPVSFDFDGDDVILISTSNTNTSYNSRIDLIGNVSPNPSTAPEVWGNNSSFIKGGCSSEVAHKDFNENDWTELVISDVNSALPNTNLALGTQTIGPTETSDGINWSNLDPDQTRTAIVNSSLTGAQETFFACNLIINPGVNVLYDSGGSTSNSIVLYGDLTVNGSLTIGDTESLVTFNPGAVLGPITKIEKSQSLNSIYEATYWSSPVAGQQISTVFAGVDPNRVFDFKAGQVNPVYAGTNYKYWHLASGTMERARGYSADGSSTGIQTITFTGIPYNGNFNKSMFYSGLPDLTPTANENFNLIGNPYPAAIDISKFLVENAVVNQIALWAKEKDPNPDGTFDPAGYIYYNQSGASSPGVTSNIGSGQGFMARALSTGGVNFNNGLKIIGQNTQFYKPVLAKNGQKLYEGNVNRLWLRLKAENTKSDILIGFLEEATDGLDDRYDAVGSLDEKSISLYSQLENMKLVIQGLGSFSPEKSVSLGIATKEAKEHTLSLTGMEGIFGDVDVYLVDHALNKTHNLKEGDYKFNQTTTGDFPNRFTLQFSKNALDVDKIIEGSEFNVYNSGEGFRINASKVVKEVKVYDMLGRMIINSKPEQQSFYLNAGNLKTGAVLIFEVKLENGTTLNKKAIKM